MHSLSELFNNESVRFTQKALDFADDKQLTHIIAALDHPLEGRANWRRKGIIPQFRNVTKNIIHKSALLYKDGLPQIEIHNVSGTNEALTLKFNDLLTTELFEEFMINFDEVLRLLKTAIILVQYDELEKTVRLSILHGANCVVHYDPFSKVVTQVIIKTHSSHDADFFRVITDSTIEDFIEKRVIGSKPSLLHSIDNPYGMIPVATFYDTHLPRSGFWNYTPRDLVNFNEAINMSLTDLNHSVAYANHQELVTNMLIVDDEGETVSADTIVGGLGQVINVDTTGVEGAFYEYKGPTVDVSQGAAFFDKWFRDIASDWSVNIKPDGLLTQAVSGFSLVVAEKENVELRQVRQRMQEMGFKRFYKVFSLVFNQHNANAFPEDTTLEVLFTMPKLPFDEEKAENIWDKRIASGRASNIDYLMDKYSITREEANEKHEIIKRENHDSDIIDDSDNE